jgi:hypothetical protein
MSLTKCGDQHLGMVTQAQVLTVTTTGFELVVDWQDLIFGNIVVDAQVLLMLFAYTFVQAVRHHLVVPALERKQFASIVVAHAHIVGDLDPATCSFF